MRLKLVLFAVIAVSPLRAGPSGATVIDGTAAIATLGKTTTINQSTDRAIINWQKFESTPTETIRFNQPGAASLTLNRVVGVDPSFLGGALQANGKLFIINPNGIVFGPDAVVSVGSLVASSLGITDADFKNNKFVFLQDSSVELSSIINRGRITASTGGTVALIAPIVDNEGTIVAAAGRVLLRGAISGALDTDNPNTGPHFVTAGKNVRMATVGLTPLLEDVVNTQSVAPANKVQRLSDGTTFLRGAAGIVTNGGSIDVSGTANAAPGTVDLQAELAVGLGQGSRIQSKTGGAPGSGTVTIGSTVGSVVYSRGGSTGHARAVAEADQVNLVSQNGNIVSDQAGSIEVRGGKVFLSGNSIGTAAQPVRVNTQRIRALAERGLGVVSDGSLVVDFIFANNPGLSLTAAGSILAGDASQQFLNIPNSEPHPVHIATLFGSFDVHAGGSFGTSAAPLTVVGTPNVTAPGGSFFQVSHPSGVFLPGLPATVSLDNSGPVPRSNYTPPSDPVVAPVTAGDVGVLASGGAPAAAVAPATGSSATGSSATGAPSSDAGATIGGRDNVLLSANRNTLVKGDTGDAPASGSTDDVVVVKNGDAPASDDTSVAQGGEPRDDQQRASRSKGRAHSDTANAR